MSEGEFVSAGSTLFDLVALDDMQVEFHLAERDSSLVSEGDRVGVRVAPFPDEVFPATVTIISPTIDPRTHTLRVKARVENREGRLRPGLFARADLGISERQDVVMIPEEAVLLRSDGSVVFRMLGADAAQRVRVTTGLHRDGLVEIVKGLSPEVFAGVVAICKFSPLWLPFWNYFRPCRRLRRPVLYLPFWSYFRPCRRLRRPVFAKVHAVNGLAKKNTSLKIAFYPSTAR